MEFTVAQIAEILAADIEGNPQAVIKTVSKIEEGEEGSLTFLANPKYTHFIYETKATAVIVNRSFVPEKDIAATLIKVDDSYASFAKLLDFYSKLQSKNSKVGISPHAAISSHATIGKDVYIGDFVSIGENVTIADGAKIYPHVFLGDNVQIGEGTTLHSGVKIYASCVVGKQCILHAGCVIGADGFGFVPRGETIQKIEQIGNVIIEDYVEIGANSCVDRATMGSTILRSYVKLDNLVQIGHNVEIGKATVVAGQSGIAGSSKIGKRCMFGGQSAINGHIVVGNDVMLAGNSAIATSTKDKEILFGRPAIPLREEQRLIVYRKKLPELYNRVDALEKKLKEKK